MSFRLDNNAFSALAKTPSYSASVTTTSADKGTADVRNDVFKVSAKTNPPDAKELTDLVMKQIGYTEQEIQAYKQKYGDDPRTDIYNSINGCISAKGCTENLPAKPGTPNAPTGRYDVEVSISKLTTHRLRGALNGIRQDTRNAVAGKTAVEQVRIIENAKRRELNGKLDNQPKPGQSNAATIGTLGAVGVAGTVGAATLPKLGALELPKVDPKAIAQGAAALGEMAIPLGAVLIEAIGPAAMLYDLHGKLAEGKAVETLAKARDAARTADFSPLQITAAPNTPQGTPPLIFPPVPPTVPPTVDQTGKVETITQTTTPAAPPQIATQLPGRSSQPLPPTPPLINPLPDEKMQKMIADLNALQMANGAHGIGTWTVTSETMSERAAVYQEQITGVPAGAVYLVNGVKFDGFADGKLLDAKAEGYEKFLNKNGEFQSWYRGANGLLEEARRQTTAAEGTPIVWHVAEEKAATAIQNLLKGKFDEITVVHTPKAEVPSK